MNNISRLITVMPCHRNLLYMNKQCISHIFSKITGFSLWDYIIARRIERAKHLLLSTDRKVLDIAFECGFQNSVHFNKCFRRQTGMTPGEYRERE